MKKRSPHIKGRKPARRFPLWLILLGGALLLALGAAVALRSRPNQPPYTPEVTGGPHLKVDREQVDLGDVKLGTSKAVFFHLENVGDQPLKFAETPYIEVKEGCWPPTPVIGSMTLQPGESTTLSMEFMMHGSMGGKHDFRVHLMTNDPQTPDRELTVLSNWAP